MKYVEGNLIELAKNGEFDMIVHGCNCFKRMKSGVALAVKTEWPQAEEADTKYSFNAGDRNILGTYSYTFVANPNKSDKASWLCIVNAYTQYTNLDEDIYTGKEGLFNIAAFVKVFTRIRFNFGHSYSIGIPKIGSHLAGGDWNVIEQILDGLEFPNLTCVVLPTANALDQ